MFLLTRLPNRLAMRAALTAPCTTKSIIEKSLSTAIDPLVVNVTEAGIDHAADVARSPIAGEVSHIEREVEDRLLNLKVSTLRTICTSAQIPKYGTKKDIITRIQKDMTDKSWTLDQFGEVLLSRYMTEEVVAEWHQLDPDQYEEIERIVESLRDFTLPELKEVCDRRHLAFLPISTKEVVIDRIQSDLIDEAQTLNKWGEGVTLSVNNQEAPWRIRLSRAMKGLQSKPVPELQRILATVFLAPGKITKIKPEILKMIRNSVENKALALYTDMDKIHIDSNEEVQGAVDSVSKIVRYDDRALLLKLRVLTNDQLKEIMEHRSLTHRRNAQRDEMITAIRHNIYLYWEPVGDSVQSYELDEEVAKGISEEMSGKKAPSEYGLGPDEMFMSFDDEGKLLTHTLPFEEEDKIDEENIQKKEEDGLKAKDERQTLLNVLPLDLRKDFEDHKSFSSAIEMAIDLGRCAEIRYESSTKLISTVITSDHISEITRNLSGQIFSDNRCGLSGTLHRISRRVGKDASFILGYTMRFGMVKEGATKLITDLVRAHKSVLIMGPPGKGKTTILRDYARMLAKTRRVEVIDKNNEIAGDGHSPHYSIGNARRLMVPFGKTQHEVMMEAVANHTPDYVIVDEIVTSEEAAAAVDIANRGVKIVATVHAKNLDSLVDNPELIRIVGGKKPATHGDRAVKEKGLVGKNIMEREFEPAFDCAIELRDRDRVVVHRDLKQSVDRILVARSTTHPVKAHTETRSYTKKGAMKIAQKQINVEETMKDKYNALNLGPSLEKIVLGGVGTPAQKASLIVHAKEWDLLSKEELRERVMDVELLEKGAKRAKHLPPSQKYQYAKAHRRTINGKSKEQLLNVLMKFYHPWRFDKALTLSA